MIRYQQISRVLELRQEQMSFNFFFLRSSKCISSGCDLLVHYGHSCLVPIQNTEGIHMLYIFVNIDINLSHFIDCVKVGVFI